MKLERFDILEVDLPFRLVFGHSLAKRKGSTNVWVRARLHDGAHTLYDRLGFAVHHTYVYRDRDVASTS